MKNLPGAGFLLQKPCDGCTHCCDGTMMIKDFGVTYGKPCENLVDGKCVIYADRPSVCRDFSCVWKSNFCDESLKPDRCGAVAKWHEDGQLTILPVEKQARKSTVNKWARFAAKNKVEIQVVTR